MAQINLIHLVSIFPSHFRFLTSHHSVRAFFVKMVREVFFWPLFLPIKKSEVRKSKVSHDINVYLLRGVKVITPFPLGGFNIYDWDWYFIYCPLFCLCRENGWHRFKNMSFHNWQGNSVVSPCLPNCTQYIDAPAIRIANPIPTRRDSRKS